MWINRSLNPPFHLASWTDKCRWNIWVVKAKCRGHEHNYVPVSRPSMSYVIFLGRSALLFINKKNKLNMIFFLFLSEIRLCFWHLCERHILAFPCFLRKNKAMESKIKIMTEDVPSVRKRILNGIKVNRNMAENNRSFPP